MRHTKHIQSQPHRCSKKMIHVRRGGIGSALILLGWASATSGDVVSKYYSAPYYDYRIAHMPDIDQRREMAPGIMGLPGNGSMYCAPTSAMNIVMYISNHGFPQVTPTANNWQDPTQYELATLSINAMGIAMSTDATDGTDGTGWPVGARAWLDPYNLFTVSTYYRSNTFTPSAQTMAHTAVEGSLVSFGIGRFDIDGTSGGNPILGDFVGGHVVTLAQASYFTSGELILGSRDPADDPDKDSDPVFYKQYQSPFGTNFYDATNETVYFDPGATTQVGITALNFQPEDTRMSLVNGYLGVKLKQGYSFTSSAGGGDDLSTWQPYGMDGSGSDPVRVSPIAATRPVVDVIAHPDLFGYLVLEEANPAIRGDYPKLHLLDSSSGDLTEITQIPNATKMILGRNRILYVMAGTSLHAINIDDPTGPILDTVTMAYPGDALTFDDGSDEVVVLSYRSQGLLRYPQNLAGNPVPEIQVIPGTVPLSGDAAMTAFPPDPVAPARSEIWFVTDAANVIYGLPAESAPGNDAFGGVVPDQISIAAIQNPTGLDFDDAGHMYVSNDNGLAEVMLDPALNRWVIVPPEDSFFGAITPGSMMRLTRSRTNYDPAQHDGWRNIDPDTGELDFGTHVPDTDPEPVTIALDSHGSYLHMCPATGVDPAIIELAPLGFFPGDKIRIEELGGFAYTATSPDGPVTLICVFSSDDTLLPATESHRVPGAIQAGEPFVSSLTYQCGGHVTDIPEDFIAGLAVGPLQICIEIPAGATHLFVCGQDSYYNDNYDPNGDFAVRLSPMSCGTDCDASFDGTTDVNDLLALLSQWGQPGPCDNDCNDVTDVLDLLALLAAWGACP
ncbi:MAG: hypothetical protein O7G85_03995 [Planctomycetota bacterium]|nr:hypothetical protein [Planctomycetota bacterium]